jgi:hypothetical protein
MFYGFKDFEALGFTIVKFDLDFDLRVFKFQNKFGRSSA